MNDAGLVRMVQRLGDLCGKLDRLPGRGLSTRQPFGKINTIHKIADNEDGVLFATNFMHTDDIRMLELCCRSRFAEELLRFVRADLIATRDFDRDHAIEMCVACPINAAEMSLPNLLD